MGRRAARDVTEAQAESILNAVLDAGINYIDTSIDYGLSEERIGRYIAHRRAEFYLASKCGCLVGATPAPPGQRNAHVFTRENIVKGVEQSLARMKTDYLDVVQFHASPSKETLEEHGALDALLELKEAGKVRFVGISATLPHLSDHIATSVFDVFQIPYSAVEREHEAAIGAAAEAGAGIVVRGGAAKGGPSEEKRSGWQWDRWRLAQLDDLLAGISPMEFILRFTFTNPDLDTTIVGTVNPAHLQSNLDAVQQGPLPPDLYDEAKRRLAAAGSEPRSARQRSTARTEPANPRRYCGRCAEFLSEERGLSKESAVSARRARSQQGERGLSKEDDHASGRRLCVGHRDGNDDGVGERRLCPRCQAQGAQGHRPRAGCPGRAALHARSLEGLRAKSLFRSISRGGG